MHSLCSQITVNKLHQVSFDAVNSLSIVFIYFWGCSQRSVTNGLLVPNIQRGHDEKFSLETKINVSFCSKKPWNKKAVSAKSYFCAALYKKNISQIIFPI